MKKFKILKVKKPLHIKDFFDSLNTESWENGCHISRIFDILSVTNIMENRHAIFHNYLLLEKTRKRLKIC